MRWVTWPVAVVIVAVFLGGCSGSVPATAATTTVATTVVVSLTFDDANADQMTAATALQTSGLHGTFYAISGSIGAPNYLTVANLQTLYSAGNEIGGHTVNHPDLTAESADEAQRQVCNARNQLTAWGFPQTSFAYPYGVVNASVESDREELRVQQRPVVGRCANPAGGTGRSVRRDGAAGGCRSRCGHRTRWTPPGR